MELDDLAGRLEQSADRVGPETERTVRRQAQILKGLIQDRASSRPGPNVITGDYRSSWRVEPFAVPDGGGATVGTDRPQGRRLELGFYDMTDSLGRHYYQPPFPHVGPSVTELEPEFQQAMRDALDRIFGEA